MNDAKLWINDADSTATITGVNVSYTMPLWVFEVMRDIIVAEAEKKVEVTHRDFDIQQELLDRYRAENAALRELVADMWFWHYEGHIDSESQERQMLHIDGVLDRMHELGVGVE